MVEKLKRIFDGKKYMLYAITKESKNNNPNAKMIAKFIRSKGKEAKVVGGRIYMR